MININKKNIGARHNLDAAAAHRVVELVVGLSIVKLDDDYGPSLISLYVTESIYTTRVNVHSTIRMHKWKYLTSYTIKFPIFLSRYDIGVDRIF